jgi:tetratricopeptide (TPR) repeat protein
MPKFCGATLPFCRQSKLLCSSILLCFYFFSYGQSNQVKILESQLKQPINDSLRVELFVKLSKQIQHSRPDSALIFAQQGLDLSGKIKYKKGEGDCLDRLGVVLWSNGKYDLALSYLLNSLKIREEINDRFGELASLNDIGIIYFDQKENKKALSYYFKAKAIAESLNDKKRLSAVLSNIGNCYIKLNKIDSALSFETQAYQIQHSINDQSAIGNTLSILGDINYKMGHSALALDYYRLSIANASKINDQNSLADTYNSIAQFYKKSNQTDSSIFYAKHALDAAKSASYPEGVYNASDLLNQIYQGKNEHFELLYLKIAMAAKDSMFNAEKIAQIQKLSFNETERQQEIVEEKKQEARERIINLQLMGIVIFILLVFLVLLLLSKSRIHRKVIEFMSVFSLLLVFEFITMFIHPLVQHFSNHLPIIELFILVALASLLVPLHHRLTHWLREKLLHQGPHHSEKKSKVKPEDVNRLPDN